MNKQLKDLTRLATLVRYYILLSSTTAGSGHPTSSLSATDLLTTLLFGGTFRADLDDFENPNNDRLIFSKGHASPLFYSLFAAAGKVSVEELKTFRKFGSNIEGHPTPLFPFAEAATGSLGQGLSIGVGMAINAKFIDKIPYNTYVLLGDSEMAEGSQWEAIQIAAYYKLDNLIGVLDVNRLGQSRETMYGHDIEAYESRLASFGWHTILIDGHDIEAIERALKESKEIKDRPTMIIAKTIKGKGVAEIENINGWHGKALSKDGQEKAIAGLGVIDYEIRGSISKPDHVSSDEVVVSDQEDVYYELGSSISPRKAYGEAITAIFPRFKNMVVLDAEVSNSTYSQIFREKYPKRYFEMFIAEQNMVGVALGLSRRGKIPFISTFAAFFTRAFDQVRMSQYSQPYTNIKFAGSHAGVSIGEDGPSQMALEDISMFRSVNNMTVLYPSDGVSTRKLVEEAAKVHGNVYIRLTRMDMPVIYGADETFPLGGSKVLRESNDDRVAVIGAGVTLQESLKAYDILASVGTKIRVIDLYSIEPIDKETLIKAARECGAIITVEDHYRPGGIGEAVLSAIGGVKVDFRSLAVDKIPKSGKPDELLDYEGISSSAIIKSVKEI